MKTFAHTKLLKENKRLVAEVKKGAEIIRANRATINAIARILPGAHIYASGGVIYASDSVRELDSFKEKKLTRILEKLTDVVGGDFVSEDIAENSNRDFRLRYGAFNISVYSYLKDQPKGCRKVLVDVKREVVERKIYQIECL